MEPKQRTVAVGVYGHRQVFRDLGDLHIFKEGILSWFTQHGLFFLCNQRKYMTASTFTTVLELVPTSPQLVVCRSNGLPQLGAPFVPAEQGPPVIDLHSTCGLQSVGPRLFYYLKSCKLSLCDVLVCAVPPVLCAFVPVCCGSKTKGCSCALCFSLCLCPAQAAQ